ncbi:class I SAM-dependent methyltransferase [Kineosporia succinea]|uniref:SAM-dependent methyltransferase n=1 Tax=Kineosporia succinea TaxID=84632 RepID=A0ABT9NWZ0_9ACTN|nr:class I SAM-dependent methyltransferase [Kineosporia succinea]MDP9824360.1 SAM-dependent methyltransferase [Kineosporia succinea]
MGDGVGGGPGRRSVRTVEDALRLLDGMFPPSADRWSEATGGSWWDGFYTDRERGVPFFADKPDENLAGWVEGSALRPGRALDLGAGPGRNALYLASRGFSVDAVDLSEEAAGWARERAAERGLPVNVVVGDAFADGVVSGPYDLVYDSGCLHHLPPHRRVSYLALLERVLAPGGHFAVTCFAAGRMGSDEADADLYRRESLAGGLAFSPDDLRWLFQQFDEVEIRPVRAQPEHSAWFGLDFLITGLFASPARPADPGDPADPADLVGPTNG